MKNFRCKICGEEYEKMPKMCPTPGCGNRNPAMWENIAPAAPRPVFTDEEQRVLEQRKAEERRRLESEEKARRLEQQRAAEQAKLRQEQQRQQEEIERQRIKQKQLRQQAEAERMRAAYNSRQAGGFSGFGNTTVNVPQAENVFSTPKKKKGKKLFVIITLLLILAIAVLAVVLVSSFNKKDSDNDRNDSDRKKNTSSHTTEYNYNIEDIKLWIDIDEIEGALQKAIPIEWDLPDEVYDSFYAIQMISGWIEEDSYVPSINEIDQFADYTDDITSEINKRAGSATFFGDSKNGYKLYAVLRLTYWDKDSNDLLSIYSNVAVG